MDFVGDDIDDLVQELSGEGEDELNMVSGTAAVPGKPNTYRVQDLPIGFAGITPTSIAAAGADTLDCPVKTAFRPDRLVLDDASTALQVTDIIIGTIRLNVGSQPVPGVAFSNDAVGTRLRCAVVATPSVFPQVALSNTTAAAITARGGFFGPMKRV